MVSWILPFGVALVTGILSSWGVGGGTLLLVCMTLFLDVGQREAQAVNLLFFLPGYRPVLSPEKRLSGQGGLAAVRRARRTGLPGRSPHRHGGGRVPAAPALWGVSALQRRIHAVERQEREVGPV